MPSIDLVPSTNLVPLTNLKLFFLAGFFKSKLVATCVKSVDLPIPGSPPISTTAPGTKPPPNTRSNSSKVVEKRFLPSFTRSTSGKDVKISPVSRTFICLPGFITASSTKVFHSPHSAQRPSHFG